MRQEEKSIFSKIIDREIPAHIIYEDELIICFLDNNPISPGHTLVVPKKPFVNIFDGDTDSLSQMMATACQIGRALKAAGLAEGINLHMSNEAVAGQEVAHAHLHVIPRTNNDGIDFHQPGKPYTETEATDIHEQITSKLTT